MGYLGAPDIATFQQRARFIRISGQACAKVMSTMWKSQERSELSGRRVKEPTRFTEQFFLFDLRVVRKCLPLLAVVRGP